MKLHEYSNQSVGFSKLYDGTFGIEIETETESLDCYPSDLLNPVLDDDCQYVEGLGGVDYYRLWGGAWKGVLDNSLRNFGVEYVLKQPLPYEEAMTAIDEFVENTEMVSFLENSPGTSVHVHINMQQEEVLTLFTFISTWTLLENILVEFSGESRRSNLFALPSRVSSHNLALYCRMVKGFVDRNRNPFRVTENEGKYAALNVACLQTLGSVEVRTLRGVTSGHVLKQWLTILQEILVYSRKNKPSDLLRLYNSGGAYGLLRTIFKDISFLSSIDNVEQRVDAALLNTYQIVSAADWDVVKEMTPKGSNRRGKKEDPFQHALDTIEGIQQHYLSIDDDGEFDIGDFS